MLSARNIHKKYGSLEVLKGVDIDIDRGEIVSIVGPSGSGKSTLLHILGTLDQADYGEVEISGVKIESRPPFDLKPALWWRRALNLVIDSTVVYFMTLGFASAIFLQFPQFDSLGYFILIFVLTHFLYYTAWERVTGRTLAKFITGTKIIQPDLGKPAFQNVLLRSLVRLIPVEVFSFFSRRPQGWHDVAGDTIVCNASIPYRKESLLSADGLSDFRNKKIGFVFQFHHLLPEFTALENVCIAGWLHSRKSEVKERAIQLLKILGLEERLNHKPGQLSGGEQQRVAIARALINKPDIVFADEPTGNLDTANAKELHRLFFDLRRELGQTFLIVTHNEELAELSDRRLMMKDGQII